MTPEEAAKIAGAIAQGKRLLLSEESDEYSWLLSVRQRPDGLFDWTETASNTWDLVGPVQYTDRVLDEAGLREALLRCEYRNALHSLR